MIEIKKYDSFKTTWADLKNSCKHNCNPLDIGDEIDIELKTGEKVTLVCELVKDDHATFFTKDLLEDTHAMDEGWGHRF